MKKTKVLSVLLIMIFISINLMSCDVINNIKEKFATKNEYFKAEDSAKVDMISIQSVRDTSFKFIVTDDKAISTIYELLASAKTSNNKSDLAPDYVFEIKMGDEIKKFNYIVGAYSGNFYDDSNTFTVSNRLDEGLIQNLSFIRKPRDFEYIYYNSILEVINLHKKEFDENKYKVGINIQGDIECLKYVFSTDIENFLKKARKITPNVDITNNNEQDFDVIITIKNRGYSSTVYKTGITVENRAEKKQDQYYVLGENEFKEWKISAYTDENIPKEVKKNW